MEQPTLRATGYPHFVPKFRFVLQFLDALPDVRYVPVMRNDLNTIAVAKRCGTTPQNVGRWIKKGYFPNAYRLSPTGDYRVPRADVTKFLRGRRVIACAPAAG